MVVASGFDELQSTKRSHHTVLLCVNDGEGVEGEFRVAVSWISIFTIDSKQYHFFERFDLTLLVEEPHSTTRLLIVLNLPHKVS